MPNPLQKKKLCWNCEGRITLETDNCPYCGVYLSPLSEDENPLFSPPYRMDNEEVEETPPQPYVAEAASKEISEEPPEEEQSHNFAEILIPLLFLLSGAVFFLFSFTLLLFSRQGVFTLSWDGAFWPLYLLIGAPLLGYGGYTLSKLK